MSSAANPVRALCDFCGIDSACWSYPAESFQLSPTPAGTSEGDWATCTACHDLIQEQEKSKLARRSLEHMKHHLTFPPGLKRSLLTEIRELHAMFFAHRIGLPRRLR